MPEASSIVASLTRPECETASCVIGVEESLRLVDGGCLLDEVDVVEVREGSCSLSGIGVN